MSQTTVNLGFVPINRGEFISNPITRYYKDNVVQFNNSSFIADPVGYDPVSNPTAYVTTPPYNINTGELNAGWRIFSSVGAIDETPTEDSDNLVRSGGVYEFSAEVGEIVGDPEGDWEGGSQQHYFEQLQQELENVNKVVQTAQLAVGAVPTDVRPTEGSGNRVTSGAVYTALKAVENKVDDNTQSIEDLEASTADNVANLRQSINEEAQSRTSSDNALSGRITTLEQAVGPGGSVDSRIDAAKTELKGNVSENNNTLEKLERYITLEVTNRSTAVTTETQRATGAEATLQTNIDTKYTKPSAGIPKTDLAQAVQTSLGKADTALQSHQSLAGCAEVGELIETI